MKTMTPTNPPQLYPDLDAIRDSGLLSPERLAEVTAAVEARISVPQDTTGRPIESARLADMSPWPRLLYTRMDHESNWEYMRRSLLAVVLTAEELELVNKHTHRYSDQARDQKRFEAATKVAAADWNGWVCDGDSYYPSVDELVAHWKDVVERGEMGYNDHPKYVWAARPAQIIQAFDVADAIENQIDDRGYEDMSILDLNGVSEFQAAIDAFVKANENEVSYQMDRRTAITIGADITKELADIECNVTGVHPIEQK